MWPSNATACTCVLVPGNTEYEYSRVLFSPPNPPINSNSKIAGFTFSGGGKNGLEKTVSVEIEGKSEKVSLHYEQG